LRAGGLASLAPLGLVLEALVGEKHLFAGGEDKLPSALSALQDPIVIFHMLLPHQVVQSRQRCSKKQGDRIAIPKESLPRPPVTNLLGRTPNDKVD
jgi:hypothetical protein